jgi:cytochrome P450 PksS
LGLPDEDRPKFTRWAGRLTTASSVFGLIAAVPGLRKIQNYLRAEFQKCRERPRPGLISALVTAERAGDRLDEEELLATTFLLLLAGHETTTHLIAGGVLALLDHPDQKAKLTADWSQAGSAVDEVLRHVSPVQMTKPRFASRDLDIHGRSIRRGDVVMPLLAAANCDPEYFEDPEKFDIDRHPNPHLGFGTGIHVCLGMKLARTEAEIAFERIFTRFPDLGMSVPSSELAWTKKIGMRSLASLPVAPTGSGTLAGSRLVS